MKIVLINDVENLGATGDVVTVKDGYARNYLIPGGFALKADPRNIKMLEAHKRMADAKVLREVSSNLLQRLVARQSRNEHRHIVL